MSEFRRPGSVRPGSVRPGSVRPGSVRPGSVRPDKSGDDGALRAPWGITDALAQMRDYRDDPALGRVWNRLEGRRRRSLGLGPVSRSFAAAALVLGGALLGMLYERQRLPEPTPAVVSSEVIEIAAPAGPARQSQRSTLVERSERKKSSGRKSRGTARSANLLAEKSEAAAADPTLVLDDGPLEVEVQEVAPPPKASWLVSAERGDFAGAFQELNESGGFDAVLVGGTSEELMTLVEVARFVGHDGRAIEALRAVTTRYQGDANAPIAAMILGNLLSRTGDATGAAEAYALNRRLSPGGDFAEDALMREFDMALADGDLASVERLRIQYEAEFPLGRHLEEIRAEALRLFSEGKGASEGLPDRSIRREGVHVPKKESQSGAKPKASPAEHASEEDVDEQSSRDSDVE